MALAHAIGERIVCAVRLSYGCRSDPQLAGAYGELAGEVRDNAPRIVYERGMTALPVDFRSCRSPSCSDGAGSGRVNRSLSGEAAAAFTHVNDPIYHRRCRAAASAGPRRLMRPACTGVGSGT